MSDYQLAGPLSREDEARLRASIREHGVIVPITLDQEGQVLDGHHRQRIAREVGVELPEPTIVECAAEEERIALAASLNADRRHLTDAQRVALGQRVEEMYADLARARQKELGRTHGQDPSGQVSGRGETRDEVAAVVGIGSGRTYERHSETLTRAREIVPEVAEKAARGEASMREVSKAVREAEPLAKPADADDRAYARAFLKALGPSTRSMLFDAERLADVLTGDEVALVDQHAATVARFAERLGRARSGLRAIDGGQS